jgi:O-Antigen ligase
LADRANLGYWLGVTAAVIAAISLGLVIGQRPIVGIALAGLALIFALPFVAPAAHLALLVFVTAVVPFSVQNGIGGGAGTASVLPSDLLLIAGLLRAALVLPRQQLDRRRMAMAFLIVVFLVLASLQFVHGLSAGADLSTVGFEYRVLLGFGTFLVAVPVLADERARRRLLGSLLLIGLAVGLWGILQYVLSFAFVTSSDAGVRAGVRFTSAGRGQVQGGLFAFPLATTIAFAVLVSGQVRAASVRAALLAMIGLNVVAILLTYERTFWVATTLGLALVALKAGHLRRAKAVLIGLGAIVLTLATLATVAPSEFTSARERLLSLGQYASDSSVRQRIVESGHVRDQIAAHPIVGSGLGASIWWGRPWEGVAPRSNTYSHNGYLWLAWKLGLPAAVLLAALLVTAVVRRGPPSEGPLFHAVRNGAQAGLLVLLLATVTFPSVSSLAITPTMGLLLAICAAPPAGASAPRNRTPAGELAPVHAAA